MKTLFKIYKLNNFSKYIDSFNVYKSAPDGITYYSQWPMKNIAMASMVSTASIGNDTFFKTPEEVIQAYEKECKDTLEEIKANYIKKYAS